MQASVQVRPAHTGQHLPLVRELFQEYADAIEIDLCFQNFEQELSTLPGAYGPPEGRLFLAWEGGEALGCAALRRFDNGICEMKRLYVRPVARGRGVGRQLATAVIEAACEIGYQMMRLDTLGSMREAISLYESIGFQRTAPYRANPSACAVFMQLELKPRSCPQR